ARVPRSPGSTLKPFLYALALERGAITPATILDDILRTPGDITNADEAFLGPLLPRVALANSRNVPAANLLDRLALDDGYAFPRMGPSEYPFPVAVKTGTSSKYRDALTVAYSTRYVVGVWLGRPDYRPMSRLTAFSSAAGLAQRILGHLHQDQQDGLEDLQFPPPRGYRAVRICALTG